MGLEKIINRILSSNSNIRRNDILRRIEQKKKEARYFLNSETAARLVAADLKVEIDKKPLRLRIQIKDIVSGLNDVSLTGKVVSSYPTIYFKRRDWTEGKLASIMISDNSGKMRVVLWDKKADLIETGKIQKGEIVKISHGYVRQGQDGKPEIHVGEKTNIKILIKATRKIAEITETGVPITVEGCISTAPEFRIVTTARKENVPVSSFQLKDDTGEVKVTGWRDIAEVVKDLPVGTKIKIRNVYAKENHEHRMELSSRFSTTLEVLKES